MASFTSNAVSVAKGSTSKALAALEVLAAFAVWHGIAAWSEPAAWICAGIALIIAVEVRAK